MVKMGKSKITKCKCKITKKNNKFKKKMFNPMENNKFKITFKINLKTIRILIQKSQKQEKRIKIEVEISEILIEIAYNDVFI